MKNLYHISFLFLVMICNSQTIQLQSFATGFTQPLEIVNAGDNRLFVVEKTGKIKILNANGTTNATPFLDISALVTTDSERGLLGLAFHPNYATNGFFFINYTNLSGNTIIARYSVNTTNPNVAQTTGSTLLTVNQPFNNHNGGSIKFGTDGFLYIGMGDGGSGGDPGNRAQNITDNLGKMLRINVGTSAIATYSIPSTNPYVGIAGNDEIWATGLRNPWKFSFNRLNGDLWIADVGQELFEEVNKVASPLTTGLNFGWRCYEANMAYNTTGCAAQSTFVTPIAAINHATSCSITGGYVYTGTQYPNLLNKYLFVDFCDNKIGIINPAGVLTYTPALSVGNIATFGEDIAGELYVAGLYNGIIYKIVDTSLSINEVSKNEFKMYPNPGKNEVFIEKSNESYPIEVVIFDTNGKLLLKQKTEDVLKNTINTSSLSNGIYLISIKNNLQESVTYKLVIN